MLEDSVIKRFKLHHLFLTMAASGVLINSAQAAGFKLWEQDAASIGNYHAGVAATANDASTAFYNPAGLVRIHNQQLVTGVDPVLLSFKFRGTVRLATASGLATPQTQSAVAQGGNTAFLPFLHYAAPITDDLIFGFSVAVPFGLKTDYGHETFARYAATKTSLNVLDISPSLGYAINDKWSVGAGLDFQHAEAEFNIVAGLPNDPTFDTAANNSGRSNAFGYHAGILFQLSEQTRIGLAYQSQVVHHLHGSSHFMGNLANFEFPGSLLDPVSGFQASDHLRAKVTLPPTTMLSIFHAFNPTWDVLGTISYTQWSVLQQLVLKNVAGVEGAEASNSIVAVFPENYRNAWTYSVGANYHLNEQFMFRTGLGYDETPASNRYRNLQLPDSDRIVVALGAHYQATKTIGFDAGWTHFFAMNTRINNLTQTIGDQVTTTDGSIRGSADIYGLSIKWDIT